MSFLSKAGGGLFGKMDPLMDMMPKPVQKISDPLNIREKVNRSDTARSLMDPLNLDADEKRKTGGSLLS